MWNELEYGGNYFGDVPDGGYRRLVGAMAVGLDLRLGAEVAEVAISAGGVRCRQLDARRELPGPAQPARTGRGFVPAPGPLAAARADLCG